MNKTRIEYLDYTWSPFVGCRGIGCAVMEKKKCYAYWQEKRQKHRCELCYQFIPHVHFERFDQPLEVKKPSKIGVCFTSDYFDEDFSGSGVRGSVEMRMLKCPQHRFLVLTKQPYNIDIEEEYPDNMAIGVSVNCKKDLWRLDALRLVKTKLRVVSFEPLYEDLGKVNLDKTGWVIIGLEMTGGRISFTSKRKWVEDIIMQAKQNDIPIFLKNNLFPLFQLKELRQDFPKFVSQIG